MGFLFRSTRFHFHNKIPSRYSLYLLWRTPPQQDAATIGAKKCIPNTKVPFAPNEKKF
jgi:hypothetical protein